MNWTLPMNAIDYYWLLFPFSGNKILKIKISRKRAKPNRTKCLKCLEIQSWYWLKHRCIVTIPFSSFAVCLSFQLWALYVCLCCLLCERTYKSSGKWCSRILIDIINIQFRFNSFSCLHMRRQHRNQRANW